MLLKCPLILVKAQLKCQKYVINKTTPSKSTAVNLHAAGKGLRRENLSGLGFAMGKGQKREDPAATEFKIFVRP